MKRLICLFVIVAACLLLFGCGGSAGIGRNSAIKVRLMRTDSTQKLTSFELYITKDAETTLTDATSTVSRASWTDDYSTSRSDQELKLGFTTRSTQTPYFVWVKVPNTGAAFETVKLAIDVDGTDGKTVTKNLTINTTQRLTGVKINRNSADY